MALDASALASENEAIYMLKTYNDALAHTYTYTLKENTEKFTEHEIHVCAVFDSRCEILRFIDVRCVYNDVSWRPF